ncbi:MAG TPA: DinB family protein [Fimbriiglobus sp.]|nr:DinB family protein [Fimbriiglobus sp.]
MSRVTTALTNIVFARRYTLRFLDALPAADWFRMPGGVTHIGWQVGHLAFSQYRLALERIRGPQLDDANLFSESFLKSFGRDSVPDPDPTRCPTPEDIRTVFDRVHDRVMAELPGTPDAILNEAPLRPHQLCKTKLECLHWCSHHEAVHAGQIGLIRRLLGYPPIW